MRAFLVKVGSSHPRARAMKPIYFPMVWLHGMGHTSPHRMHGPPSAKMSWTQTTSLE